MAFSLFFRFFVALDFYFCVWYFVLDVVCCAEPFIRALDLREFEASSLVQGRHLQLKVSPSRGPGTC